MFDVFIFVRHLTGMQTNVRSFLRDFAAFKAKARKWVSIRILDKGGDFLFTCTKPGRSLMGAAKARLAVRADLTRPTLPRSAWKPSL